MNVLHVKYAVEIAKTKSISKAAESLYMAQPNLSRAIKELEEDLGITIFKRTSKGIAVTAEGEEFLQYARRVVAELDEIEKIYKSGKRNKQRLSVCVPRASYIASALAEFAIELNMEEPAEIYYKETNSSRAISGVVKGEYNLGIVRYQNSFDKYFKSIMTEKKLAFETVAEFSYKLLLSRNHPLADKENIGPSELSEYIEITHSDTRAPSSAPIDVKKSELAETTDKRIYVFERASQFALLEKATNTFMWVSPVSDDILEKYNLTQKTCASNGKVYKDVLIYRNDYKLTELDKRFITEVCDAKRKYLS